MRLSNRLQGYFRQREKDMTKQVRVESRRHRDRNTIALNQHQADMLANNLRMVRDETGLSQEDLARICNVARNTIWRLETGTLDGLNARTLLAIAKAISVDDPYSLLRQPVSAKAQTLLGKVREIAQRMPNHPVLDAIHKAWVELKDR